jgi:hypothetical protein
VTNSPLPHIVNLAKRLRAFGDDTTLNETERVLLWEAADEIERLRTALSALVDGDNGGMEPVLHLRTEDDTLTAQDGTVVYRGPDTLFRCDVWRWTDARKVLADE